MSLSFDPVLKYGTIAKLQFHNLLAPNPDEVACWTLQTLPFPLMFPRITFYNNQIPCGFNTPSFLIYLGFRPSVAIGIYSKCQQIHYATRLTLMESVESHLNLKWSENSHVGAVLGNTPLGDSIMKKMGLIEDFIAEVNSLWELTKQDPMLMNRYLNKKKDGSNQMSLENLSLADFVHENMIERMTKLLTFDMEVNENLN